jgi:gamma-glutamylcyclotransferase (GGCT)/AIG2-like uncharacterized protein YtfP
MNLFVYGTMRNGESDSYYCSKTIVNERVWTFGMLLDTKKGFCALSPGSRQVFGQVNFVEAEQLNVIQGLVQHYNMLNSPFIFILKPINVFTDKDEIKASAFMYDTNEGLNMIGSGDWVSYQNQKLGSLF